MLSADLLERVDRYWAGFLGCSPAALRGSDAVLITSEQSPGLVGLKVAERWVLSLAPGSGVDTASLVAALDVPRASAVSTAEASAVEIQVRLKSRVEMGGARFAGAEGGSRSPTAVEGCGLNRHGSAPFDFTPQTTLRSAQRARAPRLRHTPETLREIVAAAGLGALYGPAQVLYCEPGNLRADGEAGVRRLTAADTPRIARFREGMGQLAWSLDEPERWVAAFGLFAGDELASAAAIRAWGNCIGEIFVDTLPQYRRRGYATIVTRATTGWLFAQTSLIPQYDAELTNPASLHVARTVGYEPYGWLFVADER